MNTCQARRLSRLFAPDGKCLVVAMDHPGFADKPLGGLVHPAETIRTVLRAGADALLLTLGGARECGKAIGRAGWWLSVDAEPLFLERVVETALRFGADGVKCLVYPFWNERPNSVAHLAALAADCAKWGMPLMAEGISFSAISSILPRARLEAVGLHNFGKLFCR